jgi:hypothetical protein
VPPDRRPPVKQQVVLLREAVNAYASIDAAAATALTPDKLGIG